jgi:hypothetical protein
MNFVVVDLYFNSYLCHPDEAIVSENIERPASGTIYIVSGRHYILYPLACREWGYDCPFASVQ